MLLQSRNFAVFEGQLLLQNIFIFKVAPEKLNKMNNNDNSKQKKKQNSPCTKFCKLLNCLESIQI